MFYKTSYVLGEEDSDEEIEDTDEMYIDEIPEEPDNSVEPLNDIYVDVSTTQQQPADVVDATKDKIINHRRDVTDKIRTTEDDLIDDDIGMVGTGFGLEIIFSIIFTCLLHIFKM